MRKTIQRWTPVFSAALATVMWQGAVWAQAAGNSGEAQPRTLGTAVLSTVMFGLLGIVLAIVGFKLFDAVVHFNLEQEICEKQNLAVAILCGFMVLGICIIIAATVLS